MKNLTIFILSVIAVTSCASSKFEKQSKDITIEYGAMTRGSNKKVVVTHESVTTEEMGRKKAMKVKGITSAEWNNLLKELEKVTLENMQNLNAPTDKRLYDGAPIASLTVKIKDQTYQSNSFDHGHPPAEIAALVDKIVVLSEMDKGNE